MEASGSEPRTSYDSTLPGSDSDHWFADALRSGPEPEAAPITIPLTTTLPIAGGPVTITLAGSAATAAPHQRVITAGSVMLDHGDGRRAQMIWRGLLRPTIY